MPAVPGVVSVKDNFGAGRTIKVMDLSGVGDGPFVPLHALANAAGDPWDTAGAAPSGKTPVLFSFTAMNQHSAVFTPLAEKSFNVSLWGTFVGTVVLERSFDGGTTWLALTAGGIALYTWSAPASETVQENEAGVQYRLTSSAYTSGTINSRISQ